MDLSGAVAGVVEQFATFDGMLPNILLHKPHVLLSGTLRHR
ncbi:hypothetical protein [Mycobacterium antarcticum]|nr:MULTISPECIES: hypothetical protein [unclassified Mycolicibacterium]